MKLYIYGNKTNPLIVMLLGSFCPAKALDYLYEELQADFYIVVCEYNGHYKTCYKGLKQAYPNAEFKVVTGYGHITYSTKHTDEYIQMIRTICA